MEHSTRHTHPTSWHDKKSSNDKVKKVSHRNLTETSTKSSSKGYKSNDNMNNKHEDKGGNRPVTGLRPRVKQVSRPSISRGKFLLQNIQWEILHFLYSYRIRIKMYFRIYTCVRI